MSYEFYKILHILSIVLFFCTMAISFYGTAPKHIKILSGIASFFILLAGMGLLAKLEADMTESWALGKIGIWVFLAVGAPLGAKRLPEDSRKPALFVGLVLLVLAHYLAVVKPV